MTGEVTSSILNDLNVYFDFPLICVAVSLNTRSLTEGGGKGCSIGVS